ncbi:MAG: DUF4386 domain-containing protein [Gammaproteobacteria bacterium]|nr:DUF4386 domain-containing protein [Gammaproteobacteria bacterium]MDH3768072.1 DUF4386 domain-containing protein [Gammaproteobacteria bacterium]
MSSVNPAVHDLGISLRQAALVAGLGLLIMTIAAPFAEFFVYKKIVVPGDIVQTTQNIAANHGLVLAAIFAYLAVFICDLIVAWALYFLLVPVNRALSLLTAWFRLVYTAIGFVALLKLVTVFRISNTADYVAVFGSDQLHAHVKLLLNSFRYEWNIGLILFAIHLGLLGYLVYRSGYIPRILGILLTIAGLGWLIYVLSPYLYPNADVGFIMITFVGEIIFMLWLLARGWKIQEPITHS